MQRSWLISALVLVGLAIVIAVVAVRLGDDDGGSQSTAEWADSVCTSLADWRTSIASLADVSGEPLTEETFRNRLDESQEATTTLVTELRDLGPPDVVDGDEVEQALGDAVDGLEQRYDELQAAASDALEAPSAAALAGLAEDFQALSGRRETSSRRCNPRRCSVRPRPSWSRRSRARSRAKRSRGRVKNARIRARSLAPA